MSKHAVFAAAVLALCLTPGSVHAQGREVTGRVTRAVGEVPVGLATITEVGGQGVAQSGADGTFRITVAQGDVRLLIRAIGYQRKDVMVKAGESNVAVALQEDPFKLEAVVVTGQATTVERRNATTATAQVTNDELTRAPAQSLEQAMQGKVPGATISMNSGAPGGGAQVQIRGITSILGNGQPLFVMDGVLISNDAISDGANSVTGAGSRTAPSGIGGNQDALVNRLADLNPAELESIDIMKSAAATSMYGSRGTNGVVMIRSKRGTAGPPRFSLTSRIGRSVPYRLLGTRQFQTVSKVLALPYGDGVPNPDTSLLTRLYPTGQIPFTRDYGDEFYRNSNPSYEVTGSMSGGTAVTQYYVNLTSREEVGTAPRTGARLYTLRSNIDQSFLEGKIKVGVGLNMIRNSLNRGVSGNDNTNTSPIYGFAYTPGVINLDSVDAAGTYVRNPFNGGGSTMSNPFETFQYLRLNELVFREIGTLNATWDAYSGGPHQISVRASGGVDRAQISGDLFSPPFLQYEPNDGFLGTAVRTEGNIFNYNLGLLGVWTFRPTEDISFKTAAGYSWSTQYNRVLRDRARGLLPGVETTISGQVRDGSDSVYGDFRGMSFDADELVQALNERLTIGGGVRADRSSAHGNRHKYFVYPRASAAYRFTDLGDVLNEVKIRGGWARTGNRPRFGDRERLLRTGTNIGGSATLVQATLVGNPDITPEALTEIEGGTDVTFLKSRLQFEGSAYRRKITDLLLQPATIPSGGVGNRVVNGGELSVVGVELGLSAVAVQSHDLDVNLRATFTKNKQEIRNLPSSVARFPAPGSFGAAFGRNFISPDGRTTWIWGNVPLDSAHHPLPIGILVTNPGAVVYTRDTVAGDANPDFVMGFSGSVRWKRLALAWTMDWRKGGMVADMTRDLWDEGGTSRDYDDPINRSTMGPGWDLKAPAGYTQGSYRYDAWGGGSDVRAYVESGTYVRVRDISLSYEAPGSLAEALGARSARFTLQARNPFVFSHYWSFDPEFNNFGATNLNRFIDLAPYPSNRQFYLSVDVGW